MKKFMSFRQFLFETKYSLFGGDHWPKDYIKKTLNFVNNFKNKPSWYTKEIAEADVNWFVEIWNLHTLSSKNKYLKFFKPAFGIYLELIKNSPSLRNKLISNKDNKGQDLFDYFETFLGSPYFEKYSTQLDKLDLKLFSKIVSDINKSDIKLEKSPRIFSSAKEAGYSIIKIMNHEDFYNKFGGNKTGLNGKSTWCHANDITSYQTFIGDDKNEFFVLAKDNWEQIKPDIKSENAFDEYGLSLIALVVNLNKMKLVKSTLRYNHAVNPIIGEYTRPIDKAFVDFKEMTDYFGFNVETEIKKSI